MIVELSEHRTSETKAIRLGAWVYENIPEYGTDCYKAAIGEGWNRYEGRWEEPPPVEVTIADGVDPVTAAELLRHLINRIPGMLEAEAEREARESHAKKWADDLASTLLTLPHERRQLAQTLIHQLAGVNLVVDDVPF